MNQTQQTMRRHNNPIMWVFVAFVAITFLTPTTIWIKDTHISVSDTRQGDPIEIEYDGRTVREFIGKYGVIVRDVAFGQIVCEARGGPFPYVTGSTRPDPLTMAWWAVSDSRCYGQNMPTGLYDMSTCWSIYPIFGEWVSPLSKTHCIHTEEPFHVYPAD